MVLFRYQAPICFICTFKNFFYTLVVYNLGVRKGTTACALSNTALILCIIHCAVWNKTTTTVNTVLQLLLPLLILRSWCHCRWWYRASTSAVDTAEAMLLVLPVPLLMLCCHCRCHCRCYAATLDAIADVMLLLLLTLYCYPFWHCWHNVDTAADIADAMMLMLLTLLALCRFCWWHGWDYAADTADGMLLLLLPLIMLCCRHCWCCAFKTQKYKAQKYEITIQNTNFAPVQFYGIEQIA